MTEPERRLARHLIDQARRAQLTLFPLCDYCELPFTPKQPAQRYCSHSHRSAGWRLTPAGREVQNSYKRRRRARERAQKVG